MKKSVLKKLLHLVFVAYFLLANIPGGIVLAQEATPSATLAPSPEATATPGLTVTPTPNLTLPPSPTSALSPTSMPVESVTPTTSPSPTPTVLPSVTPTVDPSLLLQNLNAGSILPSDQVANGSAAMKPEPVVEKLPKAIYRAGENVTVTVLDDDNPDKIKVELLDAQGNSVTPDIQKANNGTRTLLKIITPPQFKPGKYTLKVTNSWGQTTEQNFDWGVLAINTTKSIYAPGEVADIQMAVLDETGNMVCDAKVDLDITDPKGQVTHHSTETSSIKVNPACFTKELTLEPDYEARYTTGLAGDYLMSLTATTKNGQYSVTSTFQVKDSVPLNVERTSVTRIFPQNTYPMKLSIQANQDFTGSVYEVVPESFDISPLPDTTAYKIITTEDSMPTRQSIANADDINLIAPFTGSHIITNKFGDEEDDQEMKKKYQQYGVQGHDGVDFDLKMGTPVLAVDDGQVAKADENGDYGTTIIIQHSWGKSYYGHLSKIETPAGTFVKKGQEIALSGNTGLLTTGPHLHFGLKLNENDAKNGYFGKVNPLEYIPLENNKPITYQKASTSNFKVKVIRWDISMKAGDQLKIGYQFKTPGISPMFYTVGPLRFIDSNNQIVFSESRFWQLAIDADGSGTNSVSPNTGTVSTTGNTYTFTYTLAENMDSGGFTISVPSGWTAPQGTNGTAGYTTSVGGGTTIIGTVEDAMDSATGWAATSACGSGLTADTTVKQEGTGSIKCVNGNVSTGNEWYHNITSQNWSSYTTVGYWLRASSAITSGRLQFIYDDTASCASPLENLSTGITSANTWEYKTLTFGATTRTGIVCYGFRVAQNTALDSVTVNSDYLLLGPGTPTFSGSGPWTINNVLLTTATGDTVTVTYGSGGGTSGVTNPSSTGISTFTTQSRTAVTGTLTNIASSPTVTINPSGPTMDQIMRNGKWFNGGTEQPFSF